MESDTNATEPSSCTVEAESLDSSSSDSDSESESEVSDTEPQPKRSRSLFQRLSAKQALAICPTLFIFRRRQQRKRQMERGVLPSAADKEEDELVNAWMLSEIKRNESKVKLWLLAEEVAKSRIKLVEAQRQETSAQLSLTVEKSKLLKSKLELAKVLEQEAVLKAQD